MAHKHSDESPCECEKLKNAERETLREGLQKCTEAREAERRAREEENEKRAAEAEAEVKSLKKKLVAFQIATAVGIAVLGQEAVDKITAKFQSVQQVQEQITGTASPAAHDAPPAPRADPKKVSVGSGGWKPYVPKFDPFNTSTGKPETRGTGDISGIFAGGYKTGQEPVLVPPTVATSVLTVPQESDSLAGSLVASPLPVSAAFDPWAVFFTPSTLPFDVYSTTLALGNNYGLGDYYGTNTGGAVAPVVPSPTPLAVFAVGGLMNTRKRA